MSENKKVTYKRVQNEEEYWKEHKKMKKEISNLFRKSYKMLTKPEEFLEKYENMLAKYEFKGVISEEWSQKQRERLYRELNKPEEFKEWVKKGKENLKKKLKIKGKNTNLHEAEKKQREKLKGLKK
jgi:hypothetical protein